MASFLCRACGTQYPESDEPPRECPICLDERQYIPVEGQRWITLDELRSTHRADVREEEPQLTGIGMEPEFAIGQRALLVESPSGNVLWDCLPLLEEHESFVRERGGLAAIAISHPHYYTTMIDWAHAFACPILVHEGEREWVMRPDPSVHFWSGETNELSQDLTLLRLGGHFDGGQVLHWRSGADGRGAVLSGDIVQVVPGAKWVSFMRGYPTLIPLPAHEVERIAAALEPWEFDRIYGAWWDRVVREAGKEVVRRSVERYVRALQ